MDCFHRYYDFCNADRLGTHGPTRFEAWLDYKQAILLRDQRQCSVCGSVHAISNLDVRTLEPFGEQDALSPDNLVSVCVECRGKLTGTGKGKATSILRSAGHRRLA